MKQVNRKALFLIAGFFVLCLFAGGVFFAATIFILLGLNNTGWWDAYILLYAMLFPFALVALGSGGDDE